MIGSLMISTNLRKRILKNRGQYNLIKIKKQRSQVVVKTKIKMTGTWIPMITAIAFK